MKEIEENKDERFEICSLFLKAGAEFDDYDDCHFLPYCCYYNKSDILKQALDALDIETAKYLLCLDCTFHHIGFCGASVRCAAFLNHPACIEVILKHCQENNIQLNVEDNIPVAAREGHTAALSLLVTFNSQISCQNSFAGTRQL